jgi:branched-subunit amino acid aminotransferase/4-amino-4-deoxychorismate lyase
LEATLDWIWLNGQFYYQEVFGWPFFRSQGLQEGVYETIRFEPAGPSLLKEHVCRLLHSRTLPVASLKSSLSLGYLEKTLGVLSEKNGLIGQTSQANLLAYLDSKRLHLAISVREMKPCEGVETAILIPQRRNGLERFFQEKTFFARFFLDDKTKCWPPFPETEAVFLTPAGTLLEGARSALLFLKDGVAHTPGLGLPILPSIGRAVMLRALRTQGIPVLEGHFPASDLLKADAVYLLNALRGFLPVERVL